MVSGILSVIWIIGALGFFIFGMKVMSEGLQQVAGGGLRNTLKIMTTNRYTGVLTGFLITGVLQSSSATTVMTVSFVNAGLMSLTESAGVMMGANIGTTITAWIVSLIGKFKISSIALPIIAFAFPMMFSGRENIKRWSEVLIGFALLFLGLAELKNAVPDLSENQELLSFLQGFSSPSLINRLIFVILGTIITIVMQSSSAAMALTITLAVQGLPLDIAAAMVLGENIGTTITAEIAALVANVHAKRSARIHSMFNIVGVGWMIFLMPYVLDLINIVFVPPAGSDSNIFSIAAFHTIFNVLNVVILIGFVPLLVKLATRTVKSKGDDDEIFRLQYINQGLFNTVEISLEEAKKEVSQFFKVVQKMHGLANDLLKEEKEKKQKKIFKKLNKLEDFTDELEIEISRFLVKVSVEQLKTQSSIEIRSIFSTISDLERIADMYVRMANDNNRKNEQKIILNTGQINNLVKISNLVEKELANTLKLVESDYKSMVEVDKIKEGLSETISEVKSGQMIRVEKEHDYDVKSGIIYRDLYNSYDRIGDLLYSIAKANSIEVADVSK